jgi:Fe-S cluster assembly ATPase SufC
MCGIYYLYMSFLEVRDLHAAIDGKEILTGLDLKIGKDEVHVIMGPNGSGKTSKIYNYIWRYSR